MKNQIKIPIILNLLGVNRLHKLVGKAAYKIPFKRERGRNQGFINVLVEGEKRPIMSRKEFWRNV